MRLSRLLPRFWTEVTGLPPRFWVLSAIISFELVAVTVSTLRWIEFSTNAYDLGLYQQALWSGGHGGPFYEAPDFEAHGFGSFLQVHLSFLMYLLAPLYTWAPTAPTLFAAQAAAVGAAAVPLYALGRDVPGGTRHRGVVCALLYLGWAPLLAGTLFDFHLESFVPLLLFSLAWLWQTQRFLAGSLVAALAIAAGEFCAPFVVFLGAYFLISRLGAGADSGASARGAMYDWIAHRETRMGLLLTTIGAAGWTVLIAAQSHGVAAVYQLAPTGVGGWGLAGLSYPELSAGAIASGFWTKFTFWAAAYLLVGGVPLLVPRTQILAIPWLALTFGAASTAYVVPGYQYSFLLAVPVFFGVALGLPRFCAVLASAISKPTPPTGRHQFFVPACRAFRRGPRRIGSIGLAALLATNLVVGPLNPLILNSPELGSGYAWTYSPSPGFGSLEAMLSRLPPQAPVVTTDALFPFVANDPNSYVLSPEVGPYYRYLPFTSANLPPYVLVDRAGFESVPTYLVDSLYNSSRYTLEGLVWATPVGPILLFGPPGEVPLQYYDPAPLGHQTYRADQLDVGVDGELVTPPSSGEAPYIGSIPGDLGNVWFGPHASLPPGSYSAAVTLRFTPWGIGPGSDNATPAVDLRVTAFGLGLLTESVIRGGQVTGGNWLTVDLSFNLTRPALDVQVAGDQLSVGVIIDVGGLSFNTPSDPVRG